ncbi:N-acetylmuramic acid 6-phosphate etherase [Proteus terrae]|uniref:N-acetylmuramic acid 6-phosphate etherase n=1 Tax=Proteus terrae TaxID=1574161 RepID=UPI000BFCAF47|nr:N-acetylmuramic acid 6-phosphate etherase [Proteus terrae]ATM98620.1 N-acetylmuramic acid 6-phosphate etherase [Proteus vulgaris]MBG2837263.1 N-acetylmuramic acid 6-phosphate etherase [Proteus terrae subsp. cibarius]MBG2868850.1 N-acetylmuramic acid 6-phosphate etherase [Proteus terrae subsp. cibarius]MBJ2110642.1 N-acetylmuramic acid 6-phosphate etherase [Proteus terrae]MBJ2133231.1 N-acetylmuramic acid 6-phosphate etherase [Proteus terrae]
MKEDALSECLKNESNQETAQFSELSALELVTLINSADMTVANAVKKELSAIAKVVEKITERLQKGGRIFYVGAGTSGRLAVLDSAECPPTFGVSPTLVQAIIAGGHDAMLKAVENIEDSQEAAIEELQRRHVSDKDVVIGIAASGRTPFTVAALQYGKKLKALTVSITTRGKSMMSEIADLSIAPDVGAEVLTGSTRMKSGTAQKMILGMLSTSVMTKLGKVHKNLMVDVIASNEKLQRRAEGIVSEVCGISNERARTLLQMVNYHPRKAILMYELHLSVEKVDQITQQYPYRSLQQQLALFN